MAFSETRQVSQAKNLGVILIPLFLLHSNCLEFSLKAHVALTHLALPLPLSLLKARVLPCLDPQGPWDMAPCYLPTSSPAALSFLHCLPPYWSSCCASHMMDTCPPQGLFTCCSHFFTSSGLCSNITSSERPSATIPCKGYPVNPVVSVLLIFAHSP